jgi:single-strand DNA-binding protein
MINRVVLVGRLATDSVFRYSRDGLAISAFSVTLGRSETGGDFLPVVVFRRLAEATWRYLRKGRLVGIEGRLASRTLDTSDGEQRRVIEIVADRLRFLDPPIALGEDAPNPEPSDHAAQA